MRTIYGCNRLAKSQITAQIFHPPLMRLQSKGTKQSWQSQAAAEVKVVMAAIGQAPQETNQGAEEATILKVALRNNDLRVDVKGSSFGLDLFYAYISL